MGIASTLYRGLLERLLTPYDLTWPQFALLLHLARRGGPGGISELATAVELSQPAVTKIVQKFQTLGMVEVRRDGQDARNRLVRITALGQQRLAAIQQDFGPAFAELLADWSTEDLERMTTYLARLAATLDRMRAGKG